MADPDDEPTGSQLRDRLEAALSKNKELEAEVAQGRAATIISSQGLNFVQLEDLAEVPLDKIEETAKSLQEGRSKVFEGVARGQFEALGLKGEELDTAVKDFLVGQGSPASASSTVQDTRTEETLQGFQRARSVGAGQPVPDVNPDKLNALQKIEAGLAKAGKS